MLELYEYSELSNLVCKRNAKYLKPLAFEEMVLDVINLICYGHRRNVDISNVCDIFEAVLSIGETINEILSKKYDGCISVEELWLESTPIADELNRQGYDIDYNRIGDNYFLGRHFRADGTEVRITDV